MASKESLLKVSFENEKLYQLPASDFVVACRLHVWQIYFSNKSCHESELKDSTSADRVRQRLSSGGTRDHPVNLLPPAALNISSFWLVVFSVCIIELYSNSSSSVCALSYFRAFSFLAVDNKDSELLAVKTMTLKWSSDSPHEG